MDKKKVRPDWDEYFMNIAEVVATRSNCSRRHVAAVIVKEHRIISTGYNGTPRGIQNCFEGGCKMQTLTAGGVPCGCSSTPKWNKNQQEVRIKRECSKRGYEFLGFIGEYKTQDSKIRLRCKGFCLSSVLKWEPRIKSHGMVYNGIFTK